MPVSRTLRRLPSYLCAVGTVPDLSPREVVEAALQFGATEEKGHLAWGLEPHLSP